MITEAQARERGHGEKSAEFAAWRNAVDAAMAREFDGLDGENLLGDWASAEMFSSGMSVEDAVEQLSELVEEEFEGMAAFMGGLS